MLKFESFLQRVLGGWAAALLHLPEQAVQHHDRRDTQHRFGRRLRISKAVQRQDEVPEIKRWDFEHDLPQHCERKRFAPQAARLENTDCQEVNAHKRQRKAHPMQKTPAIADNAFVFHKHRNQEIRTEIIARRRRKQEGQRNPPGKRDDAFQPFPVAAAIAVAHQRHDALRQPHRDIHRHHIDFLRDTHRRNRVRPKNRSEIIQYGHAGHIQQVLDRRRDADPTDPRKHKPFCLPQHGGADADIGVFAFHKQQYKEIQAGEAVGKEGRKPRTRCAKPKPPRQDKNRVEHDIEQATAHRADACM